jgi:hypothetical protein
LACWHTCWIKGRSEDLENCVGTAPYAYFILKRVARKALVKVSANKVGKKTKRTLISADLTIGNSDILTVGCLDYDKTGAK